MNGLSKFIVQPCRSGGAAGLCGLMAVALIVGCGDTEDRDGDYERPTDPVLPAPVIAPEPTAPPVQYEPPRPSHYYDERDGVFYSYIAAVSEEDRKTGKVAGDVVTFAYLGENDGKHVLARVMPNGTITGRSSCRSPCRVITYEDGTQVGYNESSIIGAAFADALNGELEIASLVKPTRSRPPELQPSSVPAASSTDEWTASELALISEWQVLNEQCRDGTDANAVTACERRDDVIAPALEEANICYGRAYEAAANQTLHRCTGDSLHLTP
ncbi:hypothetical protein [Pelagerythrobacter marensis]|uniref:Lipoprotein n=1 Tax=Pelagerythrobacter marensis TaxID=543877 RepID=A0A0G3X6Z5_9SPHN|nr:hypothetical protein [Pelagerythrobacter marensis]AKM06123.1 hypothetical protein AM2010_28 [Pelagerythrobacter marensis]